MKTELCNGEYINHGTFIIIWLRTLLLLVRQLEYSITKLITLLLMLCYLLWQHALCFNSLRPSNAYMRQYNIPTLLQIMACRLCGAKPFSETMLPYCQLDPKEHISVKLYLKFKSFHSRNLFENVLSEMAAILSRAQCVKAIAFWGSL